MFEKFGEFDSYVEMNEAAKGFLNEGDFESLKAMAVENGLDPEDAEDYIDGVVPELCNELMAALGKIKVECEQLKPQEIMQDWVEYIKAQCVNNRQMASAVRMKGKTIKDCIAELLKWSFGHQIPVDKDVMVAAGVTANKCTLGIPGMATAKELINKYYLGE